MIHFLITNQGTIPENGVPTDFLIDIVKEAETRYGFTKTVCSKSDASFPIQDPGLGLKCLDSLAFSLDLRQYFEVTGVGLTFHLPEAPKVGHAFVHRFPPPLAALRCLNHLEDLELARCELYSAFRLVSPSLSAYSAACVRFARWSLPKILLT